MKKIISSILLGIVTVLPVCALDIQHVEEAVLRAEAAQAFGWPRLTREEQKSFEDNLDAAVDNMHHAYAKRLRANYLGKTLLISVSGAMLRENEFVPLSNAQQRAVYKAIYTLLPWKYCYGMMRYKEYKKAYPVRRRERIEMKSAYQHALSLVYEAVQDIADENPAVREPWLRPMLPRPIAPKNKRKSRTTVLSSNGTPEGTARDQ